MKVLFANPPWWVEEEGKPLRKGVRAGSRWPHTNEANHVPDKWKWGGYAPFPFFLGYAASYLRRALPHCEVTVRDSIARGESYEAFLANVEEHHPAFVVVESASPSWPHDRELIETMRGRLTYTKFIVAGPQGSTDMSGVGLHAWVSGEYEKGVVRAVKGEAGKIAHDFMTEREMNAAPHPAFDEEVALRYWDANPKGNERAQLQAWGSRGCAYKCLHGDTMVNTVDGPQRIRDMVGKTVGIFSYVPAERRVKIITVSDIRKTSEAEQLVRVNFDDGTFIDCTPDHKFMAFKWGNQHVGEREWMVEARDLATGQRLRSIKQVPSGSYVDTTWNRRCRVKTHRLVMEWKLGRRLIEGEEVHHKDRNKLNWSPDNLEVVPSRKAHAALHPEIAQRMREDNPTKKGITPQWRQRMSTAQLGKVRTPEARENYRRAAILREEKRRRLAYNHKVVSVVSLPGSHETYCMEVPETHLFFANDVLVKNCCFCIWPAVMTGNDPDGENARLVRFYSPEKILSFIDVRRREARSARSEIKSVYFDDDTGNISDRHTLAVCSAMNQVGLPWSMMCRADTIARSTWEAMKGSGCFGVKLGFESGSQRVVDQIVNKRLDLAKAAETARFIRSIGMTVHGTFTVGLPGETREEQNRTVDFIKELYQTGAMDTHQLSRTAEIEGTPLANIPESGSLSAYPGAVRGDDYSPVADGAR